MGGTHVHPCHAIQITVLWFDLPKVILRSDRCR